MAVETNPGFFVAPFGIDGELLGSGFWELEKLSPRWLALCIEFLDHYGAVCDSNWSGTLSHIRTKFTSASGAAIATFFVRSETASTILLRSGTALDVEDEVAQMFVESIRRSAVAQTQQLAAEAFNGIRPNKDRPSMTIVAWSAPTVSDSDHDLVRELGLHLAGAYFTMQSCWPQAALPTVK